jgi:hypothetical protein
MCWKPSLFELVFWMRFKHISHDMRDGSRIAMWELNSGVGLTLCSHIVGCTDNYSSTRIMRASTFYPNHLNIFKWRKKICSGLEMKELSVVEDVNKLLEKVLTISVEIPLWTFSLINDNQFPSVTFTHGIHDLRQYVIYSGYHAIGRLRVVSKYGECPELNFQRKIEKHFIVSLLSKKWEMILTRNKIQG